MQTKIQFLATLLKSDSLFPPKRDQTELQSRHYYKITSQHVERNQGRKITTYNNKSTERAQTSAKAKIWTKSDPRFESGFLDKSGSGSGCMSDLSQNVADALSCRSQSFSQVWYKLTVDSMRNANNCPKIPVTIVKKMEKVIRNPHADPDHNQTLISSRGSPLAHACQVSSTSVSAFVSYPLFRMRNRTIT